MKSVKGNSDSLAEGFKRIQIGQEASSKETTGQAQKLAPSKVSTTPRVSPSQPPETKSVGEDAIMTVINSDGTTSYYTSTGELITGEPPRPSQATRAVTDSDRVTAKGSLNVRSKKTERMKRKLQKKTAKSSCRQPTHFLHLPNEILVSIMMHMLPSDIYKIGQACHTLRELVKHSEALLSRYIISTRYSVLERCFRLPEPEWNEMLKEKTDRIVRRALDSPLTYVCLLEQHLKNTCASIKRQTENKGNQRRHFGMSKADAESGTDHFLERDGPATADMPFQRDGYDLLEAYLPGRTWLKNEKRWAYMPADIHDRDLAWAATRWSPVFAVKPIPKEDAA
ncbi:uncharacterized protein ColSpa_08459 [Colletotrichum spaethianum]|uniref:F-box domain-containing protein n=1 Tax=Colletotrichum spaethianum TaxID=700344 RepID=A0AA37P9S1_9PEZI|nr:uncharacterized protein ColSpa_08459 [Colletotrichum spaethianum]GKT48278.1 hypothetical protein ColSpa_08459 [Colletotrichum spaethianum]